jgi:murein DD-endopeptidase MepM/ murein hydrolase activator NlpD
VPERPPGGPARKARRRSRRLTLLLVAVVVATCLAVALSALRQDEARVTPTPPRVPPAAAVPAVPAPRAAPPLAAADPLPAAAAALEPPAAQLPVAADVTGAALLLPVQGVQASALRDTFQEARGAGERRHEAIDIPAAVGTPVLAVADGRIAKLFLSQQGGLTIYQFDTDETVAYYYAHLDRYAPALADGQQVRRGSVIGHVGVTGNAPADRPHLHFAIFRLGPQKQWWRGEAVNPFGLLGGRPQQEPSR